MLDFIDDLTCLFLLLLLGISGIEIEAESETTEFDLSTSTLGSLKLLGDAHLYNGSVHLSRDLSVPYSGSGRVLYSDPIRFRQSGSHSPVSFSTFFSISVINLNPSSIGGGLAFLLSPDDETIGEAGGFLGLGDGQGSLSGYVAVEFDTLMDLEFEDINDNHVGLDVNGMVSAQVGDLGALGIDLKSGDLVNAWLDYDGSARLFNISVSLSNLRPPDPFLSFHLDLDRLVNDFMFVGFSGSTQGSTEIHSVQWWSFNSSFTASSSATNSGSDSSLSSPTPIPFSPMANASNLPPPSPVPPPSVSNSSIPEKTRKSSSCHNQLCKQRPGAVVGVVTAGAFFLAMFAGILVWVFSKRVKPPKTSVSLASEIVKTPKEFSYKELVKTPKEFSYKELQLATRSFNTDRIIGNGAFGTVYKGIIPETGAMVAVKRCSHSGGHGKAEFLSELSIIGSLRHRNLVRLQGWCHEKGEILLVYDFMPNGSLDKALFESTSPLPWHYRRKILMGVASAMAYLHQECENQVIHRDIKTSNIMLDEAFNAKLGDFGLARQMEHDKTPDATVTAGTMGYLAPEYLLTGRATEKTDVFSFGAVVLEVASGRRPIEKETNRVENVGVSSNLVEWVWSLHREGRLLGAADARLGGDFDDGEMTSVLLMGLACSHPDPLARPTMRGVVQMLVGEAQVPMVPRSKPSMSFSTSHLLMTLQDSVSDINEMLITHSNSSSTGHSFNGGELV
ncbi:L-type lectin-domain containing receptor kinase VIII.1-like [Macadamia integrifolia]|uniref:L-type lectin-domain containing receptor kinase VIII.1-like n=1 Tax=Macadamia integrifolia TaxID=60698 RepID=UPI001C4FC3B0|nr:L-type lectin-domain containing receptor kinase VIII.1-like [Macadamia integrifolia]